MNRKISLETFIAENAASSSSKKESKLMPFKTEITELKKLGYTLDQIVEYLRLNDLIVGRSTVVYFIKNHIEIKYEALKESIKNSKRPMQNTASQLDSSQIAISNTAKNESKPQAFNWQTPISKEDLF